MSKLVNQNVHGSNTLVIFIRGKEVGRANGLNISPDFGTQPVPEGIGSIMPSEHVALEYRAEVSIETFMIRLRTGTAGNQGIQDVLGCPVGEDILLTEPFDVVVQDKLTKAPVLVCEQCTWSGVSFSIRQGAIVGKDARAQAIRVRQAANYNPKL